MRRKINGCILLCLILLFSLTACEKKRTDVGEKDTYIYCLNADRTGLVKVRYSVEEKDALKAAEAMLKELKSEPQDIDYTAPITEKIKINEVRIGNGLLYIDFGEGYQKLGPVEEKLIRAAIVKSIVKIDGISGLWFTVDGTELLDSTGKVRGVMTEDDFVQNTGSALSSYQTATLTLYFANETGDKLVAQSMDVKYSSNMSKEKLIVEKLVKGPKKNAGYPTINPDVTILGVTIKDGICYVNLDEEFLTSQIDVKPEITVYSIVNSLVEGTAASKVQITVSGEKNIHYRETFDLTQPVQSDMSWVEVKEE